MNRLGQLLFTALLVGGVVVQVIQRPWTTPITWDGFGYHLYLQLTFIHDSVGHEDKGNNFLPDLFVSLLT